MGRNHGITRDEFLYGQLEGNRTLYWWLAIVYGVITVAAAVMAVAAVAIGRLDGALYVAAMGLGFSYSARGMWMQHRDFAKALDEIGPDPTGVDTCRTYSLGTAKTISRARTDSKTQRQLTLAYGIMGIVMVGMGIFLTALMMIEDGGVGLTLLGVGLTMGGVILSSMAIVAFRNWRSAKYLESLG